MALNSFTFLLFLAVVVTVYYLVPKKYQWAVLLAASYGFYLSSGLKHVFYIIGTTLFTYLASHLMQRMRDKQNEEIKNLGDSITREEKTAMKKAGAAKIRRVQFATVFVNILVLAVIKYIGLFISKANGLFAALNWEASIPMFKFLVPLGLSYYTFNSIGYLIDVGRGKLKAEKHFGKFALFVSFFPSIVQGPLFRYGDVGMQLQQEHKFDYDQAKFGAQLILWGFFKKLVIADRISAIPGTIFNPEFTNYTGSEIFFAVLAYSFYIYCDFSGGTDITRGAAQMLGIELPENFNQPFFANSMADFWRRWHMSLGAWMREYVFYPIMLCKPVASLSKKMRKKYGVYYGKLIPSVAAPFTVFFLMGIWHNITSQYIINGLYNAFLISGSVAMEPVFKKLSEKLHINTEAFSFRVFQILRTTALLFISRIIVRAPSLTEALRMIKRMFFNFDFRLFLTKGALFNYGVGEKDFWLLVFAIGILAVVSILRENGMNIRESLAKQNLVFRWAVMLILIMLIVVYGVYGSEYSSQAFIYENF